MLAKRSVIPVVNYLVIDSSPTLSVAGCQPAGCEDAVHQRRGSVVEGLQLWGSRRRQSQPGGWGIQIPTKSCFGWCRFRCTHEGVSLAAGANLKGVDMEGSQMTGINLRVATLKNAKLKNCNLRGATLAGTDLEVRALPWTAVVFCRCLLITCCLFSFFFFFPDLTHLELRPVRMWPPGGEPERLQRERRHLWRDVDPPAHVPERAVKHTLLQATPTPHCRVYCDQLMCPLTARHWPLVFMLSKKKCTRMWIWLIYYLAGGKLKKKVIFHRHHKFSKILIVSIYDCDILLNV